MSLSNVARLHALGGFVAKDRLSVLLAVGVLVALVAWDGPRTPSDRHGAIVTRFPVGVHTELLVDPARESETGVPRKLQITVWYPARGGTGAHVTYGDDVDLTAAEHAAATDAARANTCADSRHFSSSVG